LENENQRLSLIDIEKTSFSNVELIYKIIVTNGVAAKKKAMQFILESQSACRKNASIVQTIVLTGSGLVRFLSELWAFLKMHKKLLLMPIIIVMVLLGGLMILTQGSFDAPFVYTLF
jgi:hypothetical protein